jgi:hypothetical protein
VPGQERIPRVVFGIGWLWLETGLNQDVADGLTRDVNSQFPELTEDPRITEFRLLADPNHEFMDLLRRFGPTRFSLRSRRPARRPSYSCTQ